VIRLRSRADRSGPGRQGPRWPPGARFGGGPKHLRIPLAPVGHVLHRRRADIQGQRVEHHEGDAVGLRLPLPPGNIAAVLMVAADVPDGLVRPRVSQFSGAVAGPWGVETRRWRVVVILGCVEDSIDRSFTVLVRVIRRCLPAPPHRARWPVSWPSSARALPLRHSRPSSDWLLVLLRRPAAERCVGCSPAPGAGSGGASQPRAPIVHQRPLVGRCSGIGPGRSDRGPTAPRWSRAHDRC
jgi:hypothetical protein